MSYSELRAALEALPGRDKPDHKGRMLSCPVHGEDKDPSLSMDTGTDDIILLRCHAGCSTEDIIAALGFDMADLYPEEGYTNGGIHIKRSRSRRSAGAGVREFEARYTDGTRAGLHKRADDGQGGKRIWWEPEGVKLARLALYLSWDLPPEGQVVVVEGERATLAVREAGIAAVGTYGANAMPSPAALEALRGRDVVLWPDNDLGGRKHMEAVASALAGIAASVRMVRVPADAPDKWDAADTEPDAIMRLVEAAVAPERPTLTVGHDIGLLPPVISGEFPEPPEPIAFEGILGECVDALAEGTDASRVGILGSLVALCGVLVPGRAYFHRWQPSAPYIALVGETSRGRKGTAMWRALDALSMALQADKVLRHVVDGVNSGEGLIAALARLQQESAYEPTTVCLFEEEYASLLASRGREGSTLDPKMRLAFDGGPLGNVKAASQVRVEMPYWLAALIAITPVELQRRLESGATQTGAANRWLHLPVQRRDVRPSNASPVLPGDLGEALFDARKAAIESKWGRELGVDDVITPVLMDYNDFLAESTYGLTRDLSPRLGIIAFRIALVHALADRSDRVERKHLDRAIAVTEYARRGVPWVFGATFGDDHAELLFRHLQEAEVLPQNTITQRIIRDSLKRQRAVDELQRLGLAQVRKVIPEGGGLRTELHLEAARAAFVPFVQVSRGSAPGGMPISARTSPSLSVDHAQEDDRTNVADSLHDRSTNAARPLHERARTGQWKRPCRDYTSHQTKHLLTDEGWTCPVCWPEEEP